MSAAAHPNATQAATGEVPQEIEREIFFKYIMMSGLWAQRFYQQFLGDMATENFG